jgi:hypothetical protein
MNDNTIGTFVNNVTKQYLDSHSSFSILFDENSNSGKVYDFYVNNFSEIYSTMGHLFYETNELQKGTVSYSDYLNYIESDFRNPDEKKILKTYQKRMIIVVLIHKLVSRDLSVKDLAVDYLTFLNNDGSNWYRGQSDYQWNLTPSMFRNLSNVFSNNITINRYEIEKLYTNNKMLSRWKQVFDSSVIDYKFLSYMQHSISYSPLLDFTSDFPTALSFSLGNRSAINDFAYKDASVFQIKVTDTRMSKTGFDVLPDNFYVDFVPGKYAIGTPILGKAMQTYNDIIDALTPEFIMIDEVSNDRMRYQNGKFILFYNYLSLQGTVCTWLNNDLQVTKYRIKKDEKNYWCDKLRQDFPYLMVDKMMNPYSYFSDQ